MVERSPQQANLPPTRFARLTAAGRSAVASVVVFGPAATEQVSLYFRPASGKRLEEIACGQIVFGRWTSSHGTGEELIVCRQRDDRVDVHCHGGEAAVETIQDALSSSGCVADQGEPSRLLEVQSPLSIESWQAMIEARTRRGALLMLTQFHGALQQRLFETLTAMQSGQLELAWEGLQRMDQLGAVGLHITHPWKVALVGPPNGGKSSLVNALLGFRRSIVDEQPGTTRDLVSTHTAWDGWPVQLIDTAGLRNSAEGVEHDGIDKVWQHRQQVDLFVLVFDCQQRWSPDCQQLGDVFAESLIVYNKSDLISDLAPTDTMLRDLSEESDDRPAGLLASAVTGHGLERLIEEILVQLVPVVPGLGEAVPFTEQQCQLVGDLLQLLKEEQVEEAAERLHRFLEVNCRDEAVQQPSRRLHVDD